LISSAFARRAVSAAAATVLGLSVVATAAPANADSRTLKDGRGDTWDVTQKEPVKRSGHPEGDLRKVTIKHTARKLVVTARTQNLKKTGQGVGAIVSIKTPDAVYDAAVYGEPGAWQGQSYVSGGTGGTAGTQPCETGGVMNYTKDVMTLTIPASCLARPDWVKLNISGLLLTSSDKAFFDSATSNKAEGGYTRRIEKG